MTKCAKTVGWLLLISAIFLVVLWKTLPQWLPKIAQFWLPAGSQLVLTHPPVWHDGALRLPLLRYRVQDCTLANIDQLSIGYQQGRWQLAANTVAVDTACLSKLPGSDEGAPQDLAYWQQQLSKLDLNIGNLHITPWQQYAGKLTLTSQKLSQELRYQGQQLSFTATLDAQQQLSLNQFSIAVPGTPHPFELSGKIKIPLSLDDWSEQGALDGVLTTGYLSKPLLLNLSWQQQEGVLTLTERGDDSPLARLPWRVSANKIQIANGQWQWPYTLQPLNGGINLTLFDWDQGLDQTSIEARINVITSGESGKGNAVLTLGPGNLSMINSDLKFQLSGQANLERMVLNATIPGLLSGSILNPTWVLHPGALLRAHGNVTPELRIRDARWPLAGVKVTAAGVTGRLQAIVDAQDSYWGNFNLHLDGQAQEFWPDKGNWQWRYWGNGQLPPLAARWDMGGRGSWQGTLITVDKLSTGFDRLKYGVVSVEAPRLTLAKPLTWQRDNHHPAFIAGFELGAKKVAFSDGGGYLPPAVLSLQLNGREPDSFLWQGKLQAQAIGPIALRGRWDGERLRGEGWWPKQSLTVFQPLISEELGIKLRDGELYAQAAFSAAREQGFTAGGHWVVNNGGMWLKDGELSGLDFVMSYRLENHHWLLGPKEPVMLRIASITNLFEMQNITADLQGTYPYSEHTPLTLSHVGMDILKGHLSLSALRLPQHDAAVLKLKAIDLSELFTMLKPKQLAMSGKVNGELPLYLNNPQWLVRNGWIANDGTVTLRLDPDLANSIGESNLVAGAAIDWLRYMEIYQSYATVSLDNLGQLTLRSKIHGVNTQKNAKREIVLNYLHEENVFQLWRSLRFGDNLQEWLQQTLSLQPTESIPVRAKE
ncbi:YdbH family protein [Yersinia enterocolitica subsp. palearctica]|uniref:YdbH family protein n=1 Tax=Yersinia enterocolitica TaxID=630 RepID=UPI00106449D8|nr:YdbH family protein [Yersinia enterocolitica]QBP98827.1 YdbH family protein [Yersinia enterocolitica subsp. palearctica]